MNVFKEAMDALFADPNLGIDTVYRVSGADPAVPARVILRRPDRVGTLGETRIVTETLLIDVRVSEVAAPADGDTIEAGRTVFVIQGEPIRDAEQLVWTVEARPQ
ncbi:MAG: hypothetical protein IPK66_05885 [Rhodospirillales bacterium]|nr:hypothetical protein [Rhodospirillales bacterium]